MISVADRVDIRRKYYADQLSKRKIAQRLGVHRNTLSAAIAAEQPPAYRREPRGSKLGP